VLLIHELNLGSLSFFVQKLFVPFSVLSTVHLNRIGIMDPASLAIGISGLLPIAKEITRIVRAKRNMANVPSDLSSYYTKFELENGKFLYWLENVFGADLHKPDFNASEAELPNSLESTFGIKRIVYDALATVLGILNEINALFESLGAQIERLDGAPSRTIIAYSQKMAETRRLERTARFKDQVSQRRKLFFETNVRSKSPKSRLEDYHKDLVYYNSSLHELVSLHKENVADAAFRAKVLAGRSTSAQLEDVESATFGSDEALNKAVRFKQQWMSHIEGQGVSLHNSRTDFSAIDSPQVRPDGSFRRRTTSNFATTNGQRLRIMVEWRAAPQHLSNDIQVILHDRLSKLSAILGLPEKPQELRTLPCLGWTSNIATLNNLGLIYRFPDFAKPNSRAQSLHELYRNGTLPSLSDRFKLARTLAVSLMTFHSIGWLHKEFTSENIVFFQHVDGEAEEYDIRQPFVSGFEYSRPNDAQELTLPQDGLGGDNFNPSQHPEVDRGPSGRTNEYRYSRRYDIYSLGVILLEIAFWDQWSQICRRSNGLILTRQNAQKELKSLVRTSVAHRMGMRYRNVILSCLNWPHVRESEAAADVDSFYLAVVKILDSCQCGA
jgi:hypothetical protein